MAELWFISGLFHQLLLDDLYSLRSHSYNFQGKNISGLLTAQKTFDSCLSAIYLHEYVENQLPSLLQLSPTDFHRSNVIPGVFRRNLDTWGNHFPFSRHDYSLWSFQSFWHLWYCYGISRAWKLCLWRIGGYIKELRGQKSTHLKTQREKLLKYADGNDTVALINPIQSLNLFKFSST